MLAVVGRDAVRVDAPERVRGEAPRRTAAGMLHTVLRSPHARESRAHRPRAGARTPGVHGRSADETRGSSARPASQATRSPRSRPTRWRRRARVEAIEIEWEELEAILDPEVAVARGQLTMPSAPYERGDFERALASADVVVEGTYRTSVVLHNSMETHQAVCEWVGDTLNIYISTQYIWGIRNEVAKELGIPADKVRVVCEYMGGGFGSKNGQTVRSSPRNKRGGREARALRAVTPRGDTAAGNRNLDQKLTVSALSDGAIVALGGEFVNGVGFSGGRP
jgi:xanthine dehydrogenase YagR molybdenum-binding subunit